MRRSDAGGLRSQAPPLLPAQRLDVDRVAAVAEHQRERLYTVLNTRERMLKPRRNGDTYIGPRDA